MNAQIVAFLLASLILLSVFVMQVQRLFCSSRSNLASPICYLSLTLVSMLLLRLPIINLPNEINVDESQMLAQAMRFQSHPVPWRDVDGTTSGPLNSMVLAVPIWLGLPATWQTARMVHFLLVCLTLISLYKTLRLFETHLEAQLALAPTVFLYTFAVYPDLCHYSSETLSVLLLSVCFHFLSKEWIADLVSWKRLFALGLLAGTIPFAKLQAAPLAALLVAAALGLIVRRHSITQPRSRFRWSQVGVLLLGLVLVPSIILGIVIAHGAFMDFWLSYVRANASYVQEETVRQRIETLFDLLVGASDFRAYLFGLIGVAGSLVWVRFAKNIKLNNRFLVPVLFGLVYIGFAVFCVFLAGKCFSHHLLLLVPALSLSLGLMFSGVNASLEGRTFRWFGMLCVVAFAIQLYKLPDYLRRVGGRLLHPKPAVKSEVARRVLEVSRPGDTMSVWGWMPSYYVETALIPATRDAIGHRVISRGPQQEYFRKRFLADFTKSKPPIFVDAILLSEFTWMWNWTAADRHESYPALAEVIKTDYVLWRTLPQASNPPVRIYLLNSRVAELELSSDTPASPSSSNR